jgi:ectoine hydroxylase-related dioxygenase (phytanoyl-CoA dioxygenase family)
MTVQELAQAERLTVQDVASVVGARLAAGDALGALRYAADANRRLQSPELERLLLKWRMDAFAVLPPSRGRLDWPPQYEDPFPGVTGLPMIAPRDLTTEVLGGAIQHHGALWVRGLASEDKAAELRDGIEQAFAAREAFLANEESARTSPWYARVMDDQYTADGRKFVEEGGGVWTGDCPRMMAELLDLFEAWGVVSMIEAHLGERPALSLAKSTLRRVPIDTRTDWHQDGAFLRRDVRTINLWLTLSDCGTDAPGLDLVARRIPYVVQTGSHGAIFDWAVGPGLVDILAEGGSEVASPQFKAGDALFFDQVMLHRTGARPNLTRPRWAVETWFFAPSAYPMERAPIVI